MGSKGRCGVMRDRCGVDEGWMYLWMEDIFNKMWRRRENNKIVEEGIKN